MRFLSLLTANWADDSDLTLLAAHPEGALRIRHINPFHQALLQQKVDDLLKTNEAGWHAWFAINPRRRGLSSTKRGGLRDVPYVSTLAVDIDEPYNLSDITRRLIGLNTPSAIIRSGRGAHLYWWIERTPTDRADRINRALTQHMGGDPAITVEANLRLPGTRNVKYDERWAEAVYLTPQRYAATDFAWLVPAPLPAQQPDGRRRRDGRPLNSALLAVVEAHLMHYHDGRKQGKYIKATCPLGHHQHDRGDHFTFDTELGYGKCFGKHGRALLYQVCQTLHIDVNQHGGLYE